MKKNIDTITALLNKRDEFNKKYKVGDAVKCKSQFSGIINTYVRHAATVLNEKEVIAWFAHPELNGSNIDCVVS
jgi:hypothetical protein